MLRDVQISPHFLSGEFVVSHDHPEVAAKMVITPQQLERFSIFAWLYLEPIRYYAGGLPIVILSGWRSFELNTLVGGSPTSDHMMKKASMAVDFYIPNGPSPHEIAKIVKTKIKYWKQLGIYKKKKFVHLSIPDQSMKYNEIFDGDKQ